MILSIVVPCYNESEVIKETSRRLISVLEGLIKDSSDTPDMEEAQEIIEEETV